VTGKPHGGIQQQDVGGVAAAAPKPAAGPFEMLCEHVGVEAFTRGRPPQREQIPADHLGAGGEIVARWRGKDMAADGVRQKVSI
jgi:hypothetical protein